MIPLKDDIPTRRTPIVTIVFIAINVIVYFLFERGLWDLGDLGNERVVEFGAIPLEFTESGTECASAAGGPWSPDASVASAALMNHVWRCRSSGPMARRRALVSAAPVSAKYSG